jgi:NAD(P)-dependent dehydrogenase (short-subunit alcohol dehydrogenase family)
MAGRLQGKVAIITGASRGLGQYCAVGYAREGAKVVIAARTEQESNPQLPGTIYHTAKLVEEAGGEAFPVVCNVADAESIDAMTKAVLDKWGRIDIVMPNAAVQPPGSVATIQPRHWELEFRINVHGAFHTIRSALPAMIEQGSGNIITISSIAAHRGGSHYGATKRAIESMSLGLAGELKDQGIAVNCLRPVGGIPTPGLMMGRRPGEVGPRDLPELPSEDSYVEAAVLFAMLTPQTGTGLCLTDAEAVLQLGGRAEFEKYKGMNPASWSEGVN